MRLPESVDVLRYEATMRRTKPDFDSEDAYSSIGSGLLVGVISIAFAVVVVAGFFEGIKEPDIGWICLGLFFTPVMLMQAGLSFKLTLDGVVVLFKKRRWLRGAECAQVTIVERSIDYEADYYGYEHNTFKLILRIDTEEAATELQEQLVGAHVSKRIYSKYPYAGTRTRIYYPPESPRTFLIKGE